MNLAASYLHLQCAFSIYENAQSMGSCRKGSRNKNIPWLYEEDRPCSSFPKSPKGFQVSIEITIQLN